MSSERCHLPPQRCVYPFQCPDSREAGFGTVYVRFQGKTCRMCVFFPFFLDIMDVPAGVTQEEGHTGFLIHLLSAVRALVFLVSRIQPFLSLVDREVAFCVLTIETFSTRWAFLFLFFSILVRKIPFAGIELTSQRVRRLHGLPLSYRAEATEKNK